MPVSPRLRRTAAAVIGVVAVVAAGSALAACGGDDSGDTAAFCERVAAEQALLFATPLESMGQARDLVRAYEHAGEVAPLAIDAEWQEMTDLYESLVTASVPYGDRDVAPVYASQSAALAIGAWLAENCAIDIPVATVPNPLPRPDVTAAEPPATG